VITATLAVVVWGIHSVVNTRSMPFQTSRRTRYRVHRLDGRSPGKSGPGHLSRCRQSSGLAASVVRFIERVQLLDDQLIFEDNIDFYFARQRVSERLALSNTFLPQGMVPYLAPDATGGWGQISGTRVEGAGRTWAICGRSRIGLCGIN